MSTPTAITESSMFPNAAEAEAEEAADIPRQYKRLSRSLLSHQGRWAFYVLRFDHGQQRAEITTRLQQDFGQAFTLWVTAEQFPRLVDLEVFLGEIGQQAARIELFGMDTWLDEARVREWNFRRNSFMQALSCPLLVWLTPGNLSLLATRAPDLWNWRTAIFDFCRGNSHITPDTFHNLADLRPLDSPIVKQPFARRAARIDELLHYLRQPKIQDRLADPVIVDLQLELAELLIFASRLDEAEQVIHKIPSYVESGRKYLIWAILTEQQGNPNEACRLYLRALQCYESEHNPVGLNTTLKSLGDLESRLGNVDVARTLYTKARQGFEAEQDDLGLANTLQSFGDLERRLGNIEAARTLYTVARQSFEAEQNGLGLASTLLSLGDLESQRGNIDAARALYAAARQGFEVEQSGFGLANTLQSLGNLESQLGNVETARALYTKAQQGFETEQDGLGLANTLRSLGNLEMQLENFAEAQHHYQAARLLYEQEQDYMGLAYTLIGLALCAVYLKHPSQCSHYLQQAEVAGEKSGVPHVLQYLAAARQKIAQLQ